MTDSLVIDSLVVDSRFCGPPGIGNGGYVCGRIAGYADGPVTVTLRRPPPVATALRIERDAEGSVRVLDGEALVAEGAPLPGPLELELPGPISIRQASQAGRACRFRVRPAEHPYPGCFVCGPDRRPGDGLRIMPGPVAGREVFADLWVPDHALACSAGNVRPEFLWAALDCAGGFGAFGDSPLGGAPYLLGRLSARQVSPVTAGQPHVVIGWRLGRQGRKMLAGSALFTADGQPAGFARATWIRLG